MADAGSALSSRGGAYARDGVLPPFKPPDEWIIAVHAAFTEALGNDPALATLALKATLLERPFSGRKAPSEQVVKKWLTNAGLPPSPGGSNLIPYLMGRLEKEIEERWSSFGSDRYLSGNMPPVDWVLATHAAFAAKLNGDVHSATSVLAFLLAHRPLQGAQPPTYWTVQGWLKRQGFPFHPKESRAPLVPFEKLEAAIAKYWGNVDQDQSTPEDSQ